MGEIYIGINIANHKAKSDTCPNTSLPTFFKISLEQLEYYDCYTPFITNYKYCEMMDK